MKLSYEAVCGTHVGLVRKNNQDSCWIDKDHNFFVIADGLGGHLGGEVASSLSIELMLDSIKKAPADMDYKSIIKYLKKTYEQVNKEIYRQGQIHTSLRGMGTTLVSLWLQGSEIFIGNVGDSRVYLYRDSHLWQLTDDHNLKTNLMKEKLPGVQEDDFELGVSSALTQSIGFTENVNPDIIRKQVKEGDIYLLCSDGLHGIVSNKGILDLLKQGSFENLPRRCLVKALAGGGFDNISVVAVSFNSH